MGYYVLGDQGQKYGPADVATLNMWVGEGRVVPHTMLEDEVSGGQIAAASVPGLQFQVVAPPPNNPVLSASNGTADGAAAALSGISAWAHDFGGCWSGRFPDVAYVCWWLGAPNAFLPHRRTHLRRICASGCPAGKSLWPPERNYCSCCQRLRNGSMDRYAAVSIPARVLLANIWTRRNS